MTRTGILSVLLVSTCFIATVSADQERRKVQCFEWGKGTCTYGWTLCDQETAYFLCGCNMCCIEGTIMFDPVANLAIPPPEVIPSPPPEEIIVPFVPPEAAPLPDEEPEKREPIFDYFDLKPDRPRKHRNDCQKIGGACLKLHSCPHRYSKISLSCGSRRKLCCFAKPRKMGRSGGEILKASKGNDKCQSHNGLCLPRSENCDGYLKRSHISCGGKNTCCVPAGHVNMH